MYKGALACENRTAYFTLRGTLIWQFGTDMITWELAVLKKQAREAGKKRYHSRRDRDGSGWDFSETAFHSVYEKDSLNPFLDRKLVDPKMANHLESCKNRDYFDKTFTSYAEVFSEDFRDKLDDESAPPMAVEGFEAADEPNVFEDGSIVHSLNFPRAGGDDSDSDSTGSSDRSDLSVGGSECSDSDDGSDEDADCSEHSGLSVDSDSSKHET